MEVVLSVALLFAASEGSKGSDWSVRMQAEVRAMEGYPAVLPCTFLHPPHSQHSSVRVLWRQGHGEVVYRCASLAGAPACEPGPQQDQRYRLEGDPREHDLSLRINGAALQDSGRYYCGIEVEGHEDISVEDKMGTLLRVEAVPSIVSLWVEGGEHVGYTALCQVQGSPLPDIQWLGPDRLLEGSTATTQSDATSYLTVSQLPGVKLGQQITCSASNPLGKDKAMMYLLSPRTLPTDTGVPPLLLLLLSLSLGSKAILLVGLGVWLIQARALWYK
ncbi:V-set and Ig domain-containing protein [Entelurus aequoreus]|uniref:V-set and Ig domain-containing protein n=1 Tax=Entelurus aequoreus TaxID=161455 RepID=UPI002B1DD026|nr:V-set and Ig domain-containing protein [Entelurus aequoreus]